MLNGLLQSHLNRDYDWGAREVDGAKCDFLRKKQQHKMMDNIRRSVI